MWPATSGIKLWMTFAGCPRLGLPMEFTEDFAALARPVQIGRLRAGNSLAVHPWRAATALWTVAQTS